MTVKKVGTSHKGGYRVTVLSSELILPMVWGLEILGLYWDQLLISLWILTHQCYWFINGLVH